MMTDTSAGIGARYPAWALLALWTLLFMLPFLGLRPLWLPDEARYTEVAREMLTTGDWLTPHLNGHPHLTKPPLTYWSIAGSMAMFGQNEFAARLPNALAFCAIILVTYFLALELRFRRAALWAGIIVLTSPVPVIGANTITTDTLLTLWIVLAAYFAWKWYHRRPRGRMFLYAAYAAIGLTLLTKGPAGPLVLVLAFGGLVVYTRSWKFAHEAISGWGLCILLLIAAPWYLLIMLKHEGLLQYYLSYEMAGRVFTTEHHRNNTFLMYPMELILGIVPWTIFLFAALRRKFGWTTFRTRRLSAADSFLLSWLVLPLIAFCIAKSRLPLYILSLFIPLSIAVASYLFPEKSATESAEPITWWGKKLPLALAIVTSIVLFGARIGAAWFSSPQDITPITQQIAATAGAGDYRVYSNRDNLYTLNFYLKRPVIVTDRLGDFLNDSNSAFAVLGGDRLRQEASADFAKKAKLIFSYYDYRVYYRQPIDAAKRAERAGSGL